MESAANLLKKLIENFNRNPKAFKLKDVRWGKEFMSLLEVRDLVLLFNFLVT